MGKPGLEPVHEFPAISRMLPELGSSEGSVGAGLRANSSPVGIKAVDNYQPMMYAVGVDQADPDLALIVSLWQELPANVRAQLLEIVKVCGQGMVSDGN